MLATYSESEPSEGDSSESEPKPNLSNNFKRWSGILNTQMFSLNNSSLNSQPEGATRGIAWTRWRICWTSTTAHQGILLPCNSLGSQDLCNRGHCEASLGGVASHHHKKAHSNFSPLNSHEKRASSCPVHNLHCHPDLTFGPSRCPTVAC